MPLQRRVLPAHMESMEAATGESWEAPMERAQGKEALTCGRLGAGHALDAEADDAEGMHYGGHAAGHKAEVLAAHEHVRRLHERGDDAIRVCSPQRVLTPAPKARA